MFWHFRSSVLELCHWTGRVGVVLNWLHIRCNDRRRYFEIHENTTIVVTFQVIADLKESTVSEK